MKKFLFVAASALLAGAIQVSAQFPGGPGMMGGGLGPSVDALLGKTAEERSSEMILKYKLSEEQKQAVIDLNNQFESANQGRAEMPDIFSMSEEDRQAFFSQMEDRMSEMADRQEQMVNSLEAYENSLQQILDKKQYRKYLRDRNKAEVQQQREMEQRFMSGFGGGGFGGPGGFGGFGGGGFGGF